MGYVVSLCSFTFRATRTSPVALTQPFCLKTTWMTENLHGLFEATQTFILRSSCGFYFLAERCSLAALDDSERMCPVWSIMSLHMEKDMEETLPFPAGTSSRNSKPTSQPGEGPRREHRRRQLFCISLSEISTIRHSGETGSERSVAFIRRENIFPFFRGVI